MCETLVLICLSETHWCWILSEWEVQDDLRDRLGVVATWCYEPECVGAKTGNNMRNVVGWTIGCG